ncbi:Colicin V production protein [Dokdonella koreensis DS-123]|uniref:Colicin V production protein n=2 Tax=Dokdonella TaxID=323413 RepID=A0A167H6J6_9GAMM|nr:Colicin V production protein [Dokdonella koreensis DS-123]
MAGAGEQIPMNWADYTILAVLALSVLVGLWRGFVAEVFALACWALAFWLAWMFGPALAERFSDSISVPSARVLLGYALCFVAVLIAGAIVGFVLRKLVSGSGLSGTDRLLGMVFGLVRGVALVVLVVLLLGFTPFTRDPWWSASQLLPTFRSAAAWVTDRLPAQVAAYLEPAAALAAPLALPAERPAAAPAGAEPAAPPAEPQR